MTVGVRTGRWLAAAVAVVGIVVIDAAPASAHTAGGPQPTNYRSEVVAVTPRVPGLTIEVLDLGRLVRVVNRTSDDVTVLGYAGEPYLRVGPAGVFENLRSPSLYQNRVMPAGVPSVVPPSADPAAPPEWRRRSGGTSVSWHDHRTHWTGPDPVAVRQRASTGPVAVSTWSIQLRRRQVDIAVQGTLVWEPSRSAALPVAVAIGLALLAMAAAMSRWRGRVLPALLAVLVATDVVRNL